MSAWKYKQLTPLMAVKRNTLVSAKELNELTERNLNFFISKLLDSPYRKELDTIYTQNANISNLEDVFLIHFNNMLNQIANLAPKSIANLIHIYINKFEIDTLKALITLKHAKLKSEDAWRYITPVGRLNKKRCQQILEEAEDINALLKLIPDLDYSYIIYKKMPKFEETGLVYLLESELNKNYYNELWGVVSKLRGLDKKIAKDIIGLEIMANNVKVIIRYIDVGLKKETMMNSLIIIPEVMNYSCMEKVIEKTSIRDAIDEMVEISENMGRDYRYMFESIKDTYDPSVPASQIENIVDKSILESSQLMVKRYTPYFNIASLFAFMTMKWYEIRNLRAILQGLSNNVPSSIIKKQLILSS